MSRILEVSGVGSGYGTVQSLYDVSMTVAPSQIVALVGPNGSGKTTLMRTIVGLNRCWEGELKFRDTEVAGLPPHKRVDMGLGMVPAGHRLFLGLSVEKNLRMGGYLVEDRDELANRMERAYYYFPVLKDRRRQIVGSMSGGEQQMCAIAMGLMARPRLLMIDELSMGLAPKLVSGLVETLLRVREEQKVAMVLVEQDVPTALRIADYAYVLSDGQVGLSGSPGEIGASERLREIFVGKG